MKVIPVVFLLTLPACSKGSHVEPVQIPVTKYSCQFSPSIFQKDRRIAICDSQDECSKICEANRQKEGM